MTAPLLAGQKIAILIESEFVPEEIERYQERFGELGAEVHFLSRLWGEEEAVFVGDVDSLQAARWIEHDGEFPTFAVRREVLEASPSDYAAVLVAANYVSVRLRYFEAPSGSEVDRRFAPDAPAVRFFAEAMLNPGIIKGALCHGLWLLTPRPDLLAGRHVICHEVVLADIANAGAVYTPSESGVVVDGDLVTGRSAGDVDLFVDQIAQGVRRVAEGTPSPRHAERRRADSEQAQNVLIVLSSFGFWGEELVAPMEELEKAGIRFEIATPYGHPAAVVPVSMDPDYVDPPLNRTITTPEMADKVRQVVDSLLLKECRSLETCNADDYDAILLVGGSGPVMDMNNCRALHELVLRFHEAGKPIAAECYAVGALIYTRERAARDPQRRSILWGRRVTGHPLPHDYTTEYGYANVTSEHPFIGPALPLQYALEDAVGPDGEFIGNIDKHTSVIVDGHIVTSRSVASSRECGERLVELLGREASSGDR